MSIKTPKANAAQLKLQNEYCILVGDMEKAQTHELPLFTLQHIIKLDVISEDWYFSLFILGRKKIHYSVPDVYFYSLPNTLY